MSAPREALLAVLSPEIVSALERLVDDRIAADATTAPRDSSPWLSIDEAADYLRTSSRTIERGIAKGRLRSSTLGRRRLLHRDDLDAFAREGDGGGVAPAAPPRRLRGVG